jgi:hypothetical protein
VLGTRWAVELAGGGLGGVVGGGLACVVGGASSWRVYGYLFGNHP